MVNTNWGQLSNDFFKALNNHKTFQHGEDFSIAYANTEVIYLRIGEVLFHIKNSDAEELGTAHNDIWFIRTSEAGNLAGVLWSSYAAYTALGCNLYEDVLKHLEIVAYNKESNVLSVECKGSIYNFDFDTPQNEVWHNMLDFFYEEQNGGWGG